jgi:hypothetical protein
VVDDMTDEVFLNSYHNASTPPAPLLRFSRFEGGK